MRSLNVLKSLCYVQSLKELCIDDLIGCFYFLLSPQVSEVPGFPSPNTGVAAGS